MQTNVGGIVLIDLWGNVCNPRYLKLTILAFSVVSDWPKMVSLGYFAIRAKVVGCKDPVSYF